MDFLLVLLYTLFSTSAALIILIVLFRPSSGGGLAGAFGGGGAADNVFGVRATQLIDKIVGVTAIIFVLTAVLIGVYSSAPVVDSDADVSSRPAEHAAPADLGEPVLALRADLPPDMSIR